MKVYPPETLLPYAGQTIDREEATDQVLGALTRAAVAKQISWQAVDLAARALEALDKAPGRRRR